MIKKSEVKIANQEEMVQLLISKIDIEPYCEQISNLIKYNAERGRNVVSYYKFSFFDDSNNNDMPYHIVKDATIHLNKLIINTVREAGFTIEESTDDPTMVYINIK